MASGAAVASGIAVGCGASVGCAAAGAVVAVGGGSVAASPQAIISARADNIRMGNQNLESIFLGLNTTAPYGLGPLSTAWDVPAVGQGSTVANVKGRGDYMYAPAFVKDSRPDAHPN